MGDAQKLKKAENDVNEQLTLFYLRQSAMLCGLFRDHDLYGL
jgi:hypothetical protein